MLKPLLTNQKKLVLNEENWETLRRVNCEGNLIKWTPDQSTWGLNERWDLPKSLNGRLIEDCDGITLWKIHSLINCGFPAEPLLFTVCRDETGGGHAVLCVTTDRGDFILDNRQRDIVSYDALKKRGYRFLYRTAIGSDFNGLWNKIKER